MNGRNMPTSHSGCVHICIFDSSVMPKITSGGIISARDRVPEPQRQPEPELSPWAMIEPSSAKKMNVKLA